jgi:predicted O-linked N-acetylglucosamine transferase (SPINDLY family)
MFESQTVTPNQAIEMALTYHQAGQFSQAEKIYQQVLQADPHHTGALNLLGLLAYQTGNHTRAENLLRQAIALNQNIPEFHNHLGLALHAQGQLAKASTYYHQALHLKPDFAEAYSNLGSVLKEQGQLEEAISYYRQALTLNPDFIKVYNNLAVTLKLQNQLAEAEECYRQVLARQPNLADAHYNLGNILQLQRKLEEATGCYRHALQLKPDFAEVHYNLGNVFLTQGQWAESEGCYRQALQIKPDYVEAYSNLGHALQQQQQLEEAENCYRHALQLKPTFANAYENLGTVLAAQGKLEEARSSYRQAIALTTNNTGIRIKQALLLPVIMGLPTEILESRRQVEDRLTQLLNSHPQLQDPLREVGVTHFYLVYHGLNDRDLLMKLASLYQQACPSLLYTAPHCQTNLRDLGPRKINVGFISSFFKEHTIGKVTRGIIANLSREKFRVHVFFLSFTADDLSQTIQQQADYSEILPTTSLEEARQRIAAQQLDILFYSDIGMDPFTYFLAFSRLAPVQCVTYGHPVTTGIPTIDYFLSAQHLEVTEADQHYSEKLVRLNRAPIFYYKPLPPTPLHNRNYFGLEDQLHLYACPQSLFRFHPEFDQILAQILARDPDGQVVMMEGTYPQWTELLKKRLGQIISKEMRAQVRFLPSLNLPDYLNLLAIVDVILDPFHFSSGNGAYEAFAMGTPIVNLPSRFLRGRITYNLYQQMGVMDCIADSPQHYVEIALRLGTDPIYREQIKAKIRAANHLLYEDREAVRELETFLVSVVLPHQSYQSTSLEEIKPSHDLTLSQDFDLAVNYHQAGQLSEAESLYRQLLQLKPDWLDVHNNLGSLLGSQDKFAEAATHFRHVLQLDPNFADAYYNLGKILQAQQSLEAISYYQQAIRLKPDFAEAHYNLGIIWEILGQFEEARSSYRRALELNPNNSSWKIRLALVWPVIMGLPHEIFAFRQQLEKQLAELLTNELTLNDPFTEVGRTNFYSAYHGLNDRDLQVQLATLYQRACPSLAYIAPHCQHPKNYRTNPLERNKDYCAFGSRKINIGFVSRFFHHHTIGKVTRGIIAKLSREKFRVHVFFLSFTSDEISHFIQQRADYSETLPLVLEEARQRIAAQQLDILFYSDIGMESFTYFLAFSRLAPVQCVTYGHPLTTGIPTIDYFLSTQPLEVAEADQHYSEQLVRLNRAPIFYYKPALNAPLKGRHHLGLDDQHHIYACPQTVFRFHPDFDPVLAAILARDPAGRVVMIKGKYYQWDELLTQRFQRTIPQVIDRILFLPAMNLPDYLNLLAVSDVMLDPFHFSSGNAAYEAFAMGTPIVNLPSRFLRGRITYSLYHKMGVLDCVADTPQQYVEIALRLGTDPAYREHIRAKILANNHLLYEDREAVRELEQFFVSVVFPNQVKPASGEKLSRSNTPPPELVTAIRYQQAGQLPEAERRCRQLLQSHPESVEAWGSLGNVLQEQGRLKEASACYQQILQSVPHHELTLTNLGTVLQKQGKLEEAIACYQRVLQIDPQNAPAYNNLGVIYQKQGKVEDCLKCLQQALELNPQLTEAHDNLGTVLATQGRFEEALSSYRRALELQPHNAGLKIRQALLLPVIMGLPHAVLTSRQRVAQQLEELLTSNLTLHDPLVEVGKTNFYSVYHGRNDRDLQIKLATLYQRACPSLLYIAPHCQTPVKDVGNRKINLGFISKFFTNHTIGKITKGIIANLSRDRFRVYVFFLSTTKFDETSEFIRQHADYSEILPTSLESARRQLAAQQLDILYYSDIGMEPLIYFLAFARLALVQCVAWGHPVTTGIPTMDYFISSRYLETADCETHYSETVVRLNSLLTFYYRPKVPTFLKGRNYFGLEEQQHLYLCPQSLFKLHPDFDTLLGKILREDSQGQIVFVEGDYQPWTDLLKQRFSQTLPDVMARIRFLPKQRFDDYLNLIALADVMLDPVHFGGGSTTYEALAMGVPIVTWPSEFMRGRFASGCYQRIGVLDCVADTPQQYVEIALRLGTNPLYREQVRAKIRARNHLLYEDSEVVRELERFFLSLFPFSASHHQLHQPVVPSSTLDFSQELALAARYQQEGQLAAAEQVYRQFLQVHPTVAEAHNDLGSVLGSQGQWEEAILCFRTALQLQPNFANAYYNLGGVFLLQNNLEEAEIWYRHALALSPQVVDYHTRLGFVLHNRGKLAEATECYRHALELQPDLVEVHFNLGHVLQAQNQLEGAKVCYRQALILKPNFVEAYNNLGGVLQAQHQLAEAAVCYRQALQLKPDFAEVHTNLGDALLDQSDFEEAVQCYRQALHFKPEYARAHGNLGMALGLQGHFEEALASQQQSLSLDPNNAGLKIKSALLLPVIMGLPPSILESRRRVEKSLSQLLQSDLQLHNPMKEVGETSFFLTYQGLNDRDLQIQLATLYQRACPSLLYVAPHCHTLPQDLGARKIKLGFISSFFRDHTIGKVFRGIIANLSKELFRVYVFFPASLQRDNISEFIQQHADYSEILSTVLEEAHQQLAAHQLDILCYPDIGMDPLTYFLAFARLAPVQCVTWGHPDTTGIPTLDYFISSRYFETADSDNHYSEKLVRLNSLLSFYYRPTYPQPLQSRRYFGLADQQHIYLCPQALFKFHPDFDTIMASILRQDSQGEIVLVEAIHSSWTELLKKRFSQTIPDVMARIRFVPRQSFEDYLNLMAIADVMLDPVHFGGGSTTYEAFACGIPVVTWPSSLMRGRFVVGFYQRMGVMDCVADTPAHYVAIAVRLGTDLSYRAQVKAKILAASSVLYEDREVVREFEKFFWEALATRHQRDLTTVPKLSNRSC